MDKLPVLLSIPHGGTRIPPEVRDKIALSSNAVFNSGAAFTKELYNLKTQVAHVVTTDISSLFVDVNRDPGERPPKYPNGVVKSHAKNGLAIYKRGLSPDGLLIDALLKKYYYPYHDRISELIEKRNKAVILGLDCHSIPVGDAAASPDPGQKKPLITLTNGYGETSPLEIIQRLAVCFRQIFRLKESEVSINPPDLGSFIIRTYGNEPLPWIQIALNRSLYLKPLHPDNVSSRIQTETLFKLNSKITRALTLFFRGL